MRWLVTSLRRKRTNCNGFFYWSGTGYFRWSKIGSVSRTPTVTAHNNRKVWWICDFGHEWNATIASRSDGHGCPFCSGRFPIKGVTDLQSLRSELSLEWNYDKNEGLKPSDVTYKSHKKVWWKCSRGHEWIARIADRYS